MTKDNETKTDDDSDNASSKSKIDFFDKKDSKSSDGIVKKAEDVAERRTRKKKTGAGRRSKEDIKTEKKLAKLAEDAEILIRASFAKLIGVLTVQVSLLTDDKKWQAVDDEQKALGDALVGYLDMKFPSWSTASPEMFLGLTVCGYILPRLMIVEKQSIKDNPYKGWFNKLWYWLWVKGEHSFKGKLDK